MLFENLKCYFWMIWLDLLVESHVEIHSNLQIYNSMQFLQRVIKFSRLKFNFSWKNSRKLGRINKDGVRNHSQTWRIFWIISVLIILNIASGVRCGYQDFEKVWGTYSLSNSNFFGFPTFSMIRNISLCILNKNGITHSQRKSPLYHAIATSVCKYGRWGRK